jgi:hypothetical protein
MYPEAIPFYLSALGSQPENSNFNYRLALCYIRQIGQQSQGLPYLEKAVMEIDTKYVEGRYKSTGAPPEAWLLLGDAFHRENRLQEASHAYYKYLEYVGYSDEKTVMEVRSRIAGLGISYEFQRFESHIEMVNMGSPVNSRFSDYNPVLDANQKILVYTQYWESYDRIMYTTNADGVWTEPRDLNKELHSPGDAYTTSLSADGTRLFLIRYGDFNYDIYYADFDKSKWSAMKPVPGKVNSKSRESSAAISADGKYLYFASDRKGGKGGFDLYRAWWNGSEWTDIVNLGPEINSAGNEEAPYLSHDGSILYFSSDGHESIGNMDILYSTLNASGEWTTPVNIGTPVNTTEDDVFFSYYSGSGTGYLARNLPDGYGKNDIYIILDGKPSDTSVEAVGGNIFATSEHYEKTGGFVEVDPVTQPDLMVTDDSLVMTGGTDNYHSDRSFSETSESGSDASASGDPDDLGIGAGKSVAATAPAQVTSVGGTLLGTEVPTGVNGTNDEYSTTDNIAFQEREDPFEKEYSEAPTESDDKTNHQIQSVSPETAQLSRYGHVEKKEMGKSTVTDLSAPDKNTTVSETGERISDTDSLPVYTIQILALRNAVNIVNVTLSPLIISDGEDGLRRYTYGEYRGWSKALKQLEIIKNSGYPDAFIRNITTIQNYKVSKTGYDSRAKN